MGKRWSKRPRKMEVGPKPDQAEQTEDSKLKFEIEAEEPKPEDKGDDILIGEVKERIKVLAGWIQRVLSGIEPLPNGIESRVRGSHTICDIPVEGAEYPIVRIEMDVMYQDLVNVKSKKTLEQFKHTYVDTNFGAEQKLPYVNDMLDLLEICYGEPKAA